MVWTRAAPLSWFSHVRRRRLVNPFEELTDCGRDALRVLVGASQRLGHDYMVHQAELDVVARVCAVALNEGQVHIGTPHSVLRPVGRGDPGPSRHDRISRW
jgi:hypothetical protein